MTVQLHACGEHSLAVHTKCIGSGSAPRMWGTRESHKRFVIVDRFSPTHVGNTSLSKRLIWPISVQPHACGEHSIPRPRTICIIGSAPRMWGTLGTTLCQQPIARFSPTHVGNTTQGLPACKPHAVQPHACGEHLLDCNQSFTPDGSAPRMWGTHLLSIGILSSARFSPTHVGNTVAIRIF